MPDLLAAIAQAVEALTDPHQHSEPRWEWDANRNKKPLPPHITVQDGLIQQLRKMTEPGSADTSSGVRAVPDSRPPLVLDAVSLLAAIEYGAAKRLLDLGMTVRDTVEGNLRALVSAASLAVSDTQQLIAAEVRSWRSQAEVICRWRTGAVNPAAPCPAIVLDPRTGDTRSCGARTVMVNPDTCAAWCITCGTEWEPDQFETLSSQLRVSRDRNRADANRVREEVRARKAEMAAAVQAAREQRNGGRDAA